MSCFGHRYVDLSIRFVDYPELECEVKAIHGHSNFPTSHPWKPIITKIFMPSFRKIMPTSPTQKKRHEAILADPYFNALQIKFAYAITCHKAQGGQWKAVFLDHGYLKPDELSPEDRYAFTRWLYTGYYPCKRKIVSGKLGQGVEGVKGKIKSFQNQLFKSETEITKLIIT
jgi:hypothetical protein